MALVIPEGAKGRSGLLGTDEPGSLSCELISEGSAETWDNADFWCRWADHPNEPLSDSVLLGGTPRFPTYRPPLWAGPKLCKEVE